MITYVLHWNDDGSESGVIPYMLSNRDKRLIELLEEHGMLDSSRKVEVVELKDVGSTLRGLLKELPDELCKIKQEERKRQQEV